MPTSMYDYEIQHLQQLRPHLADCTVLLKTDGAFPLSAPCRIAAYGNGVRHTIKGGTGSGEVNSRSFVTAEEGLTRAGFTVTSGRWLDGYDAVRIKARRDFLRRMKAEARQAGVNVLIYGMGRVMPEPDYTLPLDADGEAAVYVLARISGEGSDRTPAKGDIRLTDTEVRDILALNERYRQFLLVLNVGGVVDLSPVQAVRNILVLSQLGDATGDVLADLLLGRAVPSGKLTTTWAAWEEYPAFAEFGDPDDTRYTEGIYVGYRYFDTVGKRPLFPFGHGLSYTSFRTTPGTVTTETGEITVTAEVCNTGRYPGRETVQAYLSSPAGRLDKPFQALAGFAKTRTLAPGETQTLCIRFRPEELASFDLAAGAFVLEAGDYILRLGCSSADTRPVARLRLETEVPTARVEADLGQPDFADWVPDPRPAEELPALPVVVLDPGSLVSPGISPAPDPEPDEALRQLTDDQLILAAIGAFDPRGGLRSIIGNAASQVAGAAGETTSALTGAGFAPLVMADGPAGLRLTPQFYRDQDGAHGLGQGSLPQSVLELLPAPLRWLAQCLSSTGRPPKGARVEEQYAAALPIGTALAQSWDTDFARLCGDLVGSEMERFGVQIWLAPALNIHRSIRCGRNFEYYSEDPLISGRMAAAVTRGVQQHPGCAVTIKHFAVNNQEDNRYGNNSLVSARALREIYLKGFGICVREAAPLALMTSYNLLNGVHTAQHPGLIEGVLRREWGYTGVVMTDWIVGMMIRKQDKHPRVDPGESAAAGGNLFMPGCRGDFDAMKQALADGRLTRDQLLRSAARVLALCKTLKG